MIKRNQAALNRVNAFIDLIIVFLSYVFVSWLRIYVLHGAKRNIALKPRTLLAAFIYALLLVATLALMGFYNTNRRRRMTWRIKTLFIALTGSELIVSLLLFVFRLEDFSRAIMLMFYFLTLVLLSAKQALMLAIANQVRKQGYNIKHQVLIGSGALAKQYSINVSDDPELGINIDVTLPPDDLDGIGKALANSSIDEAVIALDATEYAHIETLIGLCEKNGVKYLVIPFYNKIIPAHPVVENVGDSKLIDMRANRLDNVSWAVVKRGFDIIVSGFGLVILSPLMLIIAIGVKLSSPGPILFKQVRVGYRRREFKMLKFRSMRVNDQSATAWSTAVDERRTKFGSLIRKTSMDELPQLFNVLKGDMSLVGPRPELPHFVEQFKETIPLYMVKHQVKPGITGWAQINGYRGDTSIAKRIEYDIWYIENWSPLLDLKILFKTVPGSLINDEMSANSPELDVKVGVASHKPYWMPNNPLYVPVRVGATGGESYGFTRDDSGDNISSKNANYCELTGLYWMWKNLKADYLGLAHYRRHFTIKKGSNDRRDVLTLDQAQRLLGKVDVLLPKKRNYWIETNYQQYIHAHHKEDLDETRKILEERYPEYLAAYDKSMKRRTGHRFNMFIMKRELANRYCEWLFDVLFELEKRLDISEYSANDKRVFGFVSERLLDVWLETNAIKYRDIPYIFLEKENWITKGTAFIMRKLEGGKKETKGRDAA